MPSIVILGAIVLVPVVLLMLLRVNAALVFLSLCLGSVLAHFLGPDSGTLLSLFSVHTKHSVTTSQATAQLVLLAFPVVVTTLFMLKSVPKGLKLIVNIVPSLGVGLLAALLAVPLLPASTAAAILSSDVWQQAVRLQDLIVGVSAMLCLFALLSLRPKHASEEKAGKKHKD